MCLTALTLTNCCRSVRVTMLFGERAPGEKLPIQECTADGRALIVAGQGGTKEGAVRLIEKVGDAGWQLLQEAVEEKAMYKKFSPIVQLYKKLSPIVQLRWFEETTAKRTTQMCVIIVCNK